MDWTDSVVKSFVAGFDDMWDRIGAAAGVAPDDRVTVTVTGVVFWVVVIAIIVLVRRRRRNRAT